MNKFIININFVIYLFLSLSSFSNNTVPKIENTFNNDTSEINYLIEQGENYLFKHPDSALYYFNKAKFIADKIDFVEKKAFCLNQIGIVYKETGAYDKSLLYFKKSLNIYQTLDDKLGFASVISNIGVIYFVHNEYTEALETYTKALDIYKEINDKKGIAKSYSNIGLVYYYLDYFSNALASYKQALMLFKESNNKDGEATVLGNIAILYSENDEYNQAFKYYKEALLIQQNTGNIIREAILLGNIAHLHNSKKEYNESLKYSKKSLKIAKKHGLLDDERYAYSHIYYSYKGLKDYYSALKYKELWAVMNDSIYNIENTRIISEIHTKYEIEKKEQLIKLQELEIESNEKQILLEQSENKKQQAQRIFLTIGLLLMIIIVVIVIISFIQKRKDNSMLEDKNNIINKINIEMTQSIESAKYIQQSILPDASILEKHLSDHFVYYNPKDIVSGDFYWWTNLKNHTIITAADSTGHGIPGALMSMLGISFLQEIVQKKYITNTSIILCKLRKEIIKTLNQKIDNSRHKGGMDISIISINHENNILQYSGANNSLYIITNSELKIINEDIDTIKIRSNLSELTHDSKLLYEIKPDKMPISIYDKMDKFKMHEIQLKKGDQVYMFSDGYADQFGGENGKKFKYKSFKELLLQNSTKLMIEQQQIISTTFDSWKSNLEQVDDVVIIGIKI